MKVVQELETIELNTPEDHAKSRERIRFWIEQFISTEFAVKTLRDGKFLHIFTIVKRKVRSDAGKEKVNRTGFRRGTNPLPRNLDKISNPTKTS